MAHRAEDHDPTLVEGDHNIEKEVHVTAGWVQVKVHMTDWATAQIESPVLNAMLNWLGTQKKTNLRTLLGEHAFSKESQMVWRNCPNFMTLQNTLYLQSMPKGKNDDLLLFVVPKAQWIADQNGCHQDAGTPRLWLYLVLTTRLLSVARNGQPDETNLLDSAHTASNTRVASPRSLYAPLRLLLPLISCMLISQALRPPWSQTSHLELPISWCSKTTSQSMCWAYVTPNQTAKTIAKFL